MFLGDPRRVTVRTLLLLFAVGLKLRIKTLLRYEVWGTAISHLLLTAVLGVAAAALVGGWLMVPVALTLAISFGFSSTVLAAKVLEGNRELRAVHGRVAIGILIVQDVVAVVLLAGFVLVELRHRAPMLDVRLFRNPRFSAASLAVSNGVTTIHEMSMPRERGIRDLEILLGHRSRLPVDVVPYVATTDIPQVMDLGLPAIGGDLPVDGSIGARTAWVAEPYIDTAGTGNPRFDDDALALAGRADDLVAGHERRGGQRREMQRSLAVQEREVRAADAGEAREHVRPVRAGRARRADLLQRERAVGQVRARRDRGIVGDDDVARPQRAVEREHQLEHRGRGVPV